ncbi:MAG TPA: hypothetical protein VGD21_06780 [Lysobacter sp.]
MYQHACLFVLLAVGARVPVQAAESYDSCTGYIDTLPTTIATQGTWCLRAHLATPITSGAAITIATNNVTVDCNGFRLGSLPANPASTAKGIYALNRLNATVRGCNVQGFHIGIHMSGIDSGGDLIEDNLLDGNLYAGIAVNGADNRIQRNRILRTGGVPNGNGNTYGIDARADLFDNTIDHVFTTAGPLDPAQFPVGIRMQGDGTEARSNHLRLHADGQNEIAILVTGNHVTLDRNVMFSGHGSPPVAAVGIQGKGTGNTFCTGNTAPGSNPQVVDCHLVP